MVAKKKSAANHAPAPSIDRDPPLPERTLWAKWGRVERGDAPSLIYGGSDARNYLIGVFESDKGIFGTTFAKQLEEWGYDLTTLKFSIKRPAEHPWIRGGRTLYRQDRKPGHLKVLYVRCRGKQRHVMAECCDGDGKRVHDFGSRLHGDKHNFLDIETVERFWQPTKPESHDWTPDELPPMYPMRPTPERI